MLNWPTEMPLLHDGDVALRPAIASDIPLIFRGCQDPQIPAFTRVPARYTMAHAQEFISRNDHGVPIGAELRFAINYTGKLPIIERALSKANGLLGDDDIGSEIYKELEGYKSEGIAGYVAGVISIHSIDVPSESGEIGYWATYPFRGLGIMTRAARMITQWGFNEVGLQHIRGLANPDNHASQKVLLKSGYEFVSLLKNHQITNGTTHDMNLYAAVKGGK